MNPPGLSRCALFVGCVAFAACNNATPPQETAASSTTHLASATEKVLYRFGSRQHDGKYPYAGLTYVDGTLYGMTSEGMLTKRHAVLYSVTPSGTYTILHTFANAQGELPLSGLTAVGGDRAVLFGTAFLGGTYGGGTVFESTLEGRITVLHSFPAPAGMDGVNPMSNLRNVNGTLYGTTETGGKGRSGTVFSITPSGSEKIIYNFAVEERDGRQPAAGLVEVDGTLYGTTAFGTNCCKVCVTGCGTVFSITPDGKESVLHRFQGGSNDGAYPTAPLVSVNGTLYGTTIGGGSTGCRNAFGGCGTVFRITRSGKESIVYKFGGSSSDGANPAAGPLYLGGKLYGTTYAGGITACRSRHYATTGCGTVFTITPSGAESVLYRFVGGRDGANPQAGVIDVNGDLYGTTEYGGEPARKHSGYGTIYSITL